MIDRKSLLTDLKKQVGVLEGDLRERATDDPDTHARLHGEWQNARAANRIAATYESWLDDRVTQAAVAWVLGTVFLRFCEDNGLIEMPFLAGPGEGLALAQERQADYIRENPHDTDRDWILAGFTEMSRSPVAAGLFDKAHNPMWQIEIPHHAAKALLAFWRRRDEDGETVHDFTDPEWDTRFLGDLYQDLSEHAKKTYALLQTPEFVEEFILDYTLEPAVDEFGLDGLRLIDPTCGSGHFLLGAFHRILNKWRAAEPATDIWELIRRTLLSVHGVDKNPFATNIARFRLLAATMKAGGVSNLASVPEFPIIVATGDSLLHGRGAQGIQKDLFAEAELHAYATEDIYDFISNEVDTARDNSIDLLGVNSYQVVVGNPPYITVKDKQENENYRAGYKSCTGTYALSVPFAERFFQLASTGSANRVGVGYVGQITANSFTRREFGKKLINEYFPTVDLTHLIDTSGAFIPGHGTPTVIILGRRRWPKGEVPIRTVMGIKVEVDQPDKPSLGVVWKSITDNISNPGYENEWVSVADAQRRQFSSHPWNLTGGATTEMMRQLNGASGGRLSTLVKSIGRTTVVGEDEAWLLPNWETARRLGEKSFVQPFVIGEAVRDFNIKNVPLVRNPYVDREHKEVVPSDHFLVSKSLWPLRSLLRDRVIFGQKIGAKGRAWYEHLENYTSKLESPYFISFAEVSTHNHFSYADSGNSVFNKTASVIKLKEEASGDAYLDILGILNSSTVCFWLKGVCFPKGGSGMGRGIQPEPWMERYAFNGANIGKIPLPSLLPSAVGRRLHNLAKGMQELSPETLIRAGRFDALAEAETAYNQIRGRMVAFQEELDWDTYSLYGLLDARLTVHPENVPVVRPGERAFEIVLARKINEGQVRTEWFRRHGVSPTMEVPSNWPESYRRIVEERIEVIENRQDIALLERPECKRRWVTEPWEAQKQSALRNWLLTRCEDRSLWFVEDEHGSNRPGVMTSNQLTDKLRSDEDFVFAARLYAGVDAELSEVICEISQDEHVPHLAALRYRAPLGLRKWAQWVDTWEQQREEDRTGTRLDIPAPPRYASADFLRPSYWRSRGKMDVPKERFISYPESGPDGDSSLLLGWAGWDHREQAQALMMLIEERATQDGWDAARMTPLLAGLAEVLPWVRQWHGEVDPAFGQSPADAYTTYLESKQHEYGLSDDDLKNWRPEQPKRGGRKKKDS